MKKTDRMNRKRHISPLRLMLKSAVFRLAFLMFIIIVPICILTLVMSNRAIRMAENQVSGDLQEALNLNMNQLDNYLQNLDRRLYTISRENEDYARLMHTEGQDSAAQIDEMHAYLRLRNVFSEVMSEYTWVGDIQAFFPDRDLFISAGNVQTEAVRTQFVTAVSTPREPTGKGWYIVPDSSQLMGVFAYRNTYYGASFRLDDLLDQIRLDSSSNIVAFADQQTGSLLDRPDLSGLDLLAQDANVTVNHEKYIILTAPSQHSELILVDLVSRAQLDRTLPGYMRILFLISIVFLFCIPLLFLAFARWLVRPVNILIDAIDYVDDGNLDYRIDQKTGTYEFDLLNSNFNEMMDSVKDLKINVYEKELERQDIRLQYLSQQIQPHFILNAMNIIYSYEPEEYDLIQKMVLCLSKYFQFIVNANRPYVKVKHELEHIVNYLTIQKIRYGNRIEYEVKAEESARNAIMPPLMIQNLVENVIKYALRDDDETVFVTVYADCQGDTVQILIRDTGRGINDETLELIRLFQETKVRQEGLGVGIQNTIERLELFFGSNARFEARRWHRDEGTEIRLSFPLKSVDEQEEDGSEEI